MLADPISRYLDGFGDDMRLAREARALQIAHALHGMEHEMEYMGRVSMNEIRVKVLHIHLRPTHCSISVHCLCCMLLACKT